MAETNRKKCLYFFKLWFGKKHTLSLNQLGIAAWHHVEKSVCFRLCRTIHNCHLRTLKMDSWISHNFRPSWLLWIWNTKSPNTEPCGAQFLTNRAKVCKPSSVAHCFITPTSWFYVQYCFFVWNRIGCLKVHYMH